MAGENTAVRSSARIQERKRQDEEDLQAGVCFFFCSPRVR